MFNKCDKKEFELFVGISGKICFRRNSVVHGGEFSSPTSIVHGAIEYVEAYRKANLIDPNSTMEAREGIQIVWKPPSEGQYKVNWDASVDSGNRVMGIGFVVRDFL